MQRLGGPLGGCQDRPPNRQKPTEILPVAGRSSGRFPGPPARPPLWRYVMGGFRGRSGRPPVDRPRRAEAVLQQPAAAKLPPYPTSYLLQLKSIHNTCLRLFPSDAKFLPNTSNAPKTILQPLIHNSSTNNIISILSNIQHHLMVTKSMQYTHQYKSLKMKNQIP